MRHDSMLKRIAKLEQENLDSDAALAYLFEFNKLEISNLNRKIYWLSLSLGITLFSLIALLVTA